MRFCKYNGAGNDFIIINNMDGELAPEQLPGIAVTLCRRRMSIGADGLMVVEKSTRADYRMRFFNSDGSVGEMCGNGARCICRYGYETDLADEDQLVETDSGLVMGHRISRRVYRVRLTDPTVVKAEVTAVAGGKEYRCGYVELGSPGLPHAVVHMPGLRDIPKRELFDLGRALRYSPMFPHGANVNFYDITGPNRVFERTYERGVEDFTFACGTGTASVALILALRGETGPDGLTADMEGGTLRVELKRSGGAVVGAYLTGPTNRVAEGEILDEDLKLE